jgi:tetratricopeptide (TPR) repeat protein
MAKKKLTRKQLLKEPDEFLTWSARTIQWAKQHQTQVILGVAAVFAVVLVAAGIRFFSERSENKAFTLLDRDMIRYHSALADKDANQALHSVAKDFDTLLKNHSGDAAEKVARMVYADICFKGGDIDRAIALYTAAAKDFENHLIYQPLIASSLGYAYEAKKDFKTAADFFRKAATAPDAVMPDQALFNLGLIYAKMADKAKSIEAFKKIVSDYPDSMYLEMAKANITG